MHYNHCHRATADLQLNKEIKYYHYYYYYYYYYYFQCPVVAPQALGYTAYTEMPNKWRAGQWQRTSRATIGRYHGEYAYCDFLGSHGGDADRFKLLRDITLCQAVNSY